jgi:hypothetical protein
LRHGKAEAAGGTVVIRVQAIDGLLHGEDPFVDSRRHRINGAVEIRLHGGRGAGSGRGYGECRDGGFDVHRAAQAVNAALGSPLGVEQDRGTA